MKRLYLVPMLRFIPRYILAASLLLLLSCAQEYRWSLRHPAFPPNSPVRELGMPDLGDRWILVRGAWFSEKLRLDPSQVYDSVGNELQQSFNEAISQAFPSISILPKGIIDTLCPQEAIRLDDRVYLKGRLPSQGQLIQVNHFAVPQLLLIHELTLGPNLSRESLYDYEKANQDAESRPRKVQTLTVLATWTLWDNRNQHPLISGISEASKGYQGEAGDDLRTLINALIHQLASSIQNDMQGATAP